MKNVIIYLVFCCSMLFSSVIVQPQEQIKEGVLELRTLRTNFVVGSKIVLEFSRSDARPFLYCSSSYGTTVLAPILKEDGLVFEIPSFISKKTGIVNWQLLDNDRSVSGQFNIEPSTAAAKIETYLGPPSIIAGGRDFSMLVLIPTDSLDNPLPDNSLVTAKHQFLDMVNTQELRTKNFIAFENIHSYDVAGRILVSSSCMQADSKEFNVDVSAAPPTAFQISHSRPHPYADGNQITLFKTSVLSDMAGNVVSDGTYVLFLIEDENGHVLKTSGTTLNGVASAKMIHPEKATKWTIKAIVEGIAESESIILSYEQVVKDFKVLFSQNGRAITVGPLKSFMQQIIPDGFQVRLRVYDDGTLVHTDLKTSLEGITEFELRPEIFQAGHYDLVVEVAGIEKNFKMKLL